MFVVCCLLRGVRWLLCGVVCGALRVSRCLPSVVCCLLSAVRCAACCMLLVV